MNLFGVCKIWKLTNGDLHAIICKFRQLLWLYCMHIYMVITGLLSIRQSSLVVGTCFALVIRRTVLHDLPLLPIRRTMQIADQYIFQLHIMCYPALGRKVAIKLIYWLIGIRNIRSQDYSFPGTFVPWTVRSLELLFLGPFVPGPFVPQSYWILCGKFIHLTTTIAIHRSL